MIQCRHCEAETSNGLALCDLCQRYVNSALAHLPIYFRNLARWRPGRTGSRQVPGSRVLYDGHERTQGTGDRISDRLDEASSALTTWARVLVENRPHFPMPLTLADAALTGELPDEMTEGSAADVAAWLCQAFGDHLTSIATLDWCGEFVRDLAHHEKVLRDLTPLVPGWYGGACRHCSASTYVLPGLTWVTCGSCDATTYARDHLDVVLDEAQDWLARPKAMAEAIVALVDTEPSVPRLYARIRWWASNAVLTPVHRVTRGYVWDEDLERMVVADQATGPAQYRLGDVLALVLRDTRSLDAMRVS